MDGAAPQAAAGPVSRRGSQQDRWRAFKNAHPEAELEWETTAMGRMARARLAPDQPWTGWRLEMTRVIDELERMAATSGEESPAETAEPAVSGPPLGDTT
jgi:hypothetical protein